MMELQLTPEQNAWIQKQADENKSSYSVEVGKLIDQALDEELPAEQSTLFNQRLKMLAEKELIQLSCMLDEDLNGMLLREVGEGNAKMSDVYGALQEGHKKMAEKFFSDLDL